MPRKEKQQDPFHGKPYRGVVLTIFEISTKPLLLDLQYIAWGLETCPKTGRPHFQTFAYAKMAQRFSWWKKRYPKAHIEPMFGVFRDSEEYCSKEGQLEELGERPALNGDQKVKHYIIQKMEEGEHPFALARRDGAVTTSVAQYHNFWEKMWNEIKWEKMCLAGFVKKEVRILVGKSDAGKTRFVYDKHGYLNVCRLKPNGKWFDGFNGHEAVIFDECDFRNIMPITDFLSITDGYPIRVEVKGSFTIWDPKCIYFTSNFKWKEWWPYISTEQIAAVERRVTEVLEF